MALHCRRCPASADYLDLIAGHTRGPGAALARAGLSLVEPVYASAARVRNALFDRDPHRAVALGRPAVSVGNLTTGGTGKTPVVLWLAARLLAVGRRPAVLLRGYRSKNGVSDEAELYRQVAGLEVEADPDRIAGAAAVLRRSPAVDVFLLDDAFQHRRAKRAFDLVLIDATNPFGHDHVLPRGLLREPLTGLRRASAVLITHAHDRDDALRARLRVLAPTAPIFTCRHVVRGLIDPAGRPLDPAALAPAAGVAGIGNPDAFFDGVEAALGLALARRIALPDHAAYDVAAVARLNLALGEARTVVVTEKDWVKLRPHAGGLRAAVARAVLGLDFADGNAAELFERVLAAVVSPTGTAGKA